SLAETAARYLNVAVDEDSAQAQSGEQGSFAFGTETKRRVAREAIAVHTLAPVLEEHLRNQGIWELATTLEFPLIGVLARMENNGILVDHDYLGKLDADFGQRVTTLERTIQDLAGETFNVNSQPQLQRILFEKLGLPKTKKIKTGYS